MIQNAKREARPELYLYWRVAFALRCTLRYSLPRLSARIFSFTHNEVNQDIQYYDWLGEQKRQNVVRMTYIVSHVKRIYCLYLVLLFCSRFEPQHILLVVVEEMFFREWKSRRRKYDCRMCG